MFWERQRSIQSRHITYPLIFNVTYPNVELTLKSSPSKPCCCFVAIITDPYFEACRSMPDSKVTKQNEIAHGFPQLLQPNIGILLSARLYFPCKSNPMEQRPFWEVSTCSAGQDTSFILYSAKDYLLLHSLLSETPIVRHPQRFSS